MPDQQPHMQGGFLRWGPGARFGQGDPGPLRRKDFHRLEHAGHRASPAEALDPDDPGRNPDWVLEVEGRHLALADPP